MINNFAMKLINKVKEMRFPLLKEWGWVIFILSFCLFARAQAASFRHTQKTLLKNKIDLLGHQLYKKHKILHDSKLKLASLSDPEMIKLLLMENLGLIKEGQTKVIFIEAEAP